MKGKVKVAILFVTVLLIGSFQSFAQSIRGKVIYVSSLQEVKLKFRSTVENYSFVNKSESKAFRLKVSNNKSFHINSLKENFKPASLVITEGENTHLFILAYKSNLDEATETQYDFSTRDALLSQNQTNAVVKQQVRVNNEFPAKSDPIKNTSLAETDKVMTQSAAVPETKSDSTEIKANPIDQKPAPAELKSSPDEKKTAEQKSVVMDSIAEIRKEVTEIKTTPENLKTVPEVSKSITNDLKQEPSEAEIRYAELVDLADQAFIYYRLDDAKHLYTEALELKPNDPWCISRLRAIQTAKESSKTTEKKPVAVQNVSVQNDAKASVKVVNTSNPDNSKSVIIPANTNESKQTISRPATPEVINSSSPETGMSTDSRAAAAPGTRLASKETAKNDKTVAVIAPTVSKEIIEADARYSAELDKANKAFYNKDYSNAKAFYQRAQRLKPTAKYPGVRITQINAMMSNATVKNTEKLKGYEKENANESNETVSFGDRVTARPNTSQNKEALYRNTASTPKVVMDEKRLQQVRDSVSYEMYVHYADSSAWITKDYRTALKWYDSAQKVKPLAAYPKKQIKVVKQMLIETDEQAAMEMRTIVFNRGMVYYREGDKLRVERKYDEAYRRFSQFLEIVDTTKINEYKMSDQYYIKQGQDYLRRLESHISKPKVTKTVVPVETEEKPVKKKRKG
ncbi:MAG TPA: hypothetical protein VGD17_05115 [Chitinophagaceae bacterium]